SRRRHTRCLSDWSSDVCSSDLVRLQATIALAEVGPDARPAVGAITKLLGDPFESVRASAVFALGRIGDPSVDQVLAAAESSNDQIGRASCRERVKVSVGGGTLK